MVYSNNKSKVSKDGIQERLLGVTTTKEENTLKDTLRSKENLRQELALLIPENILFPFLRKGVGTLESMFLCIVPSYSIHTQPSPQQQQASTLHFDFKYCNCLLLLKEKQKTATIREEKNLLVFIGDGNL